MPAPGSGILFVAHDPGARNHLGPLHRHAIKSGCETRFIDLADQTHLYDELGIAAALKADGVALVVAGCSANRAEWVWIAAAQRIGKRSAMMIDIGVGTRLDHVTPMSAPDRFLVTNEQCVRELEDRGFPSDRIRVTGNPYLESLADSEDIGSRNADVRDTYGVESHRPIISVFLPPESVPAGVLERLHSLLLHFAVKDWVMVVRPHPRGLLGEDAAMRKRCDRLTDVVWDSAAAVRTPHLLASSVCSFSFGSTVSAESLALGTPSAFFQIGWEYGALEALYRNLESIPRLRTPQQVFGFVAEAMSEGRTRQMPPIERVAGATESGWLVLQDLLHASEFTRSKT